MSMSRQSLVFYLTATHTQQDDERTSCMQIRMTENHSCVDFCHTLLTNIHRHIINSKRRIAYRCSPYKNSSHSS